MNIIDAGAAKLLAGLQIDTLQKVRDGQITLSQWERFNLLSTEDREERFGDWKRPKPSVAEVKVYLRRLFEGKTIMVSATDGTETFVSSGLFPGGIYGVTLPVGGKPTLATNTIIHELVENGKFAEFFGSLGENRPRWKGENQIVAFIRDHKNKLRTGGYATFFELEGGFVAGVSFGYDGQLEMGVYEFSRDDVWSAKDLHRVVSPQQ